MSVPSGEAIALSETAAEDAPTSSGSSWTCVRPDPDNDGETLPVAVTSGSVTVPGGTDVTCTITNSTAELTVLKQVDGEGISASDFSVSAEATALPSGATPSPSQEDLPNINAAEGATVPAEENSVLVYPGATYKVSEGVATGKNPVYLQKAFQKYTPGAKPPAGSEANVCAAVTANTPEDLATVMGEGYDHCWKTVSADPVSVAAGERGIYRFVNIEPGSPTLPVTGGASSFIYLVLGLSLVGAAAGAEMIRRKKRGSGAHVA